MLGFYSTTMNNSYLVELHRASAESDVRTLRDILTRNPNLINHPDCSEVRQMLLFKATFEKNVEIVELLFNFPKRIYFEEQDNINKHLSSAVYKGNQRLVEFLLRHGASLEGPEWQGDLPGQRIFHRDNFESRKDILITLIEYGMNIRILNHQGQNLLHQFIFNYVKKNDEDAAKIAEILLTCGIPVDQPDKNGYSPLMLALSTENIDLITILIEKGADVNKKSTNSGTLPILVAGRLGNPEIVDLLLTNGAEINGVDDDGWSPLHVACFHNHDKVVNLLIRRGADMSACDNRRRTPYHFLLPTSEDNYDRCMQLMIKEFARLEFANEKYSEQDLNKILENSDSRDLFHTCVEELGQMETTQISPKYSVYAVFQMSKELKKLARLLKNENFTQELFASLGGFSFYENDLRVVLEEAFLVKDNLEATDLKLYSVFGEIFHQKL